MFVDLVLCRAEKLRCMIENFSVLQVKEPQHFLYDPVSIANRQSNVMSAGAAATNIPPTAPVETVAQKDTSLQSFASGNGASSSKPSSKLE